LAGKKLFDYEGKFSTNTGRTSHVFSGTSEGISASGIGGLSKKLESKRKPIGLDRLNGFEYLFRLSDSGGNASTFLKNMSNY